MSKKPCFILNCKSSYSKENETIAFFHPPKSSLESWQEVVRKPGLTCQSRICSNHFEENDIVKGREIQGVFYNYPKWKLKPGARPSKLLGNDVTDRPAAKVLDHNVRFQSPYRNTTSKSKSPNVMLVHSGKKTFVASHSNVLSQSHELSSNSTGVELPQNAMEIAELVGSPCETTEVMLKEHPKPSAQESETQSYIDPATYGDFIARVKLPSSSWMWQEDKRNKTLVCFNHSFYPDRKIVVKTISVVSKNKVELFINGKQISPPSNVQTHFHSIEDLSNIIAAVDVTNVCDGIVELSLTNVNVTPRCSAVKDGQILRSRRCTGFTESNVCLNCKFLKKYLMTRVKHLSCNIEKKTINKKNQQRTKILAKIRRRNIKQGKAVSGIAPNSEKGD